MKYANLRKNIIALATLPAWDEAIVSTYFNLQQPAVQLLDEFASWVKITRKTFEGKARDEFDDSVTRIEQWLTANIGKGKSAAVFARSGEHPFFLPLTFNVPMESFFQVEDRPVIYPLVEIKDRFHRFVVVLTTQESARIVEINLGEASTELLAERPAVRERHGREWTREHYQNHCRDRDKKFLLEKVSIINSLMAKRGHNALIIAGEPRYVTRLQEALPKHLQEKVVNQIRTGISDERVHQILEEAIDSYLLVEQGESTGAVKNLFRAFRTNGLATLGVTATENALMNGWADHLVISSSLELSCREKLVRLASQHGIPIETVRDSRLLDEQGGVGAHLRFLPRHAYQEETENAA